MPKFKVPHTERDFARFLESAIKHFSVDLSYEPVRELTINTPADGENQRLSLDYLGVSYVLEIKKCFEPRYSSDTDKVRAPEGPNCTGGGFGESKPCGECKHREFGVCALQGARVRDPYKDTCTFNPSKWEKRP